jgi:dihydrofolate reductase
VYGLPVTRTRLFCGVSLDGYIASSDGSIDWLRAYEGGEAESSAYERFFADVGALALGATTHRQVSEDFGVPWPYGATPSWIFSHHPITPPASAVVVTDRPVTEIHPEMVRAAGGKDIWVVGGRVLADQFAHAGLIDDVTLTYVPVVLGDGIPFLGRALDRPLTLAGSQVFPSGLVELRYVVD